MASLKILQNLGLHAKACNLIFWWNKVFHVTIQKWLCENGHNVCNSETL